MVGENISHYKILEKLGEGGMGVVYLAEDTNLERKVAIKFLPHYISANSEERERFKIEAKAAAGLNHPNIATIYSIDETADQTFIAMEYIEGRELKSIVEMGHPDKPGEAPLLLPINDVINYGIQIAEGLEAAHEKGIVHRDIKSSNIMITNDGKVKITDFGLAKIKGGAQVTKIGTIVGTAAYMSPEQAKGEEIDHRTDIWSFGVVLFEMLTEHLPFCGEYENAMMYLIVNEDPEPLTRYRNDIPEALQIIIYKALQKNPGARYQTSIEMLTDLKRLQEGITSASAEFSFGRSRGIKPNNLPIQLTSFIGRENEITEVKKLLSIARMVTLTGPGGTGKTRLALQVAANLRDEFEHGIFFVALAPISDPKVVASTISQVLKVSEVSGQTPIESLKQYLLDKQMLLLLDNFEQILAAAILATELLTACSKLKILVTSRATLHVSGEQEFPVPPLSLPSLKYQPSLETLSQSEAVALFIHRGQAIKPDFTLDKENASEIAEICIHLDGLPLAVELAAARIKSITPQMMLPRLKSRLKLLTGGPRDLPTRQQTLLGTIEWSYALLNDDERKILRRLSIFAGGCTLEAAEAVCNTTTDLNMDILEGLASLVDKSLLRQFEDSRFLMLETIREFALECLITSGETESLHRAHRDLFLKLSEEAEPQLTGPHQKKWLEQLDQEHDNLRAAFDWSLKDKSNLEAGLRLGAALWRYWLMRGYLNEGRERLANLISNVGPSVCTEAQAKVLNGAGQLAQNQADYASARSFFEQSLVLYRRLGFKRGIATSLNNVGWLEWRLGNYTAARALSEESLVLNREMEDDRGIATSLNNLGFVAYHQGDYVAAHSFHQESLTLRRKIGDKRNIAFSLTTLGWTIEKQGDYDQASAMLEEAMAMFQELGDKQNLAFARIIFSDLVHHQFDYERAVYLIEEQVLPIDREIGSKYGIAFAVTILGDVMLHQGNYSRAAALHKESLALRKETEDKWGVAQSLHRLGEVGRYQGDHDRAFMLYRESLVLRKEMEDKMGIIECLEGLAGLASQQNKLVRALQLLESAKTLREKIGAPLPPCLRSDHEHILNTIQTRLGQQEYANAIALGSKMAIEQAIEFALLKM